MTVEPYLAALVWKTRRPVRMVWERQESLLARQKRHPFRMHYRTGVLADGTIVAQDIKILGDAGAYPLLSSRVLFAGGVNSTGPYRCADARMESTAVFTNTVPDQRLPRVRRDAGGVRLRVADGSDRRAPGPDSGAGARAQLREPRRHPRHRRADRDQPGTRECMHRALEEMGELPAPDRRRARRPRLRLQHAALRPVDVLRRPRIGLDRARAGRDDGHPRRRDRPRRGPGGVAGQHRRARSSGSRWTARACTSATAR